MNVTRTNPSNPFTAHPASAGETYFAHLRTAASFGWQLTVAGLACFVHALLPFLFVRTGSDCICRLYQRMQARRQKVECADK